jgi:hypothetical protein
MSAKNVGPPKDNVGMSVKWRISVPLTFRDARSQNKDH